MSGTTELIYKTTSPDALAWFADFTERSTAVRKVQGEFQDRMTQAIPTWPGDHPNRPLVTIRGKVVGLGFSYEEFSGRRWSSKINLPTGWRVNRDWDRVLVPHKGTKEGKALAAEMAALPSLDLRTDMEMHLGVPANILVGMRWYTPGVDTDRDENDQVTAIYVTWGSGRCAEDFFKDIGLNREKEGLTIDVEWEEIPRSVWYAREEAKVSDPNADEEDE